VFWSRPKSFKDCSKGEQTKFIGIGATVFFTAVMAFIASSYALFTVFDNPYIAMGFGLVWGLLIFNLDRFIVSTIRKRDNLAVSFYRRPRGLSLRSLSRL
jgi:FtsH-binding integral membrane protein